MTSDPLRAQYEQYPYPARDPRDERRRLVVGSPSDLDEIVHYVFGGRLDRSRRLRVLVAGGGTGDATIMLAQHCKDAGIDARIDYVDLSDASRAIAEARAEARGLTMIRFHRGSLLDLPALGFEGPCFDYIDCCGVLHHLEDPDEGLRRLAAVLAPGGGIGMMVYGVLGRTGVYPLQETLRMLGRDDPAGERVVLARRLIEQLPPTNWFRRNPLLGDHHDSDAGLYDLLLHGRDRPYAVEDVAALAAAAGLEIASFIEPARYDPATYLSDPRLLRRLDGLTRIERAGLAERIAGSMTKHVAYLVRPEDRERAVARPDGPEVAPVLKDLDGPALARGLKPGAVLSVDLGGVPLRVPLPRLAGPILARIDGRTPLGAIHEALRGMDGSLSWEAFETQFGALYERLNGLNKMLLRRP